MVIMGTGCTTRGTKAMKASVLFAPSKADEAALKKAMDMLDYRALRQEQAEKRAKLDQ